MIKKIDSFFYNIIPKEYHWKILLLNKWGEIIGDLKNKVFIVNIFNGGLTLGIIHPALLQELYLLTPVLKQKINNTLSGEYIKIIKLKCCDNFYNKDIIKISSNFKKQKTIYTHKYLSDTEKKIFLNIKDNELKNILEKFFVRCKNIV